MCVFLRSDLLSPEGVFRMVMTLFNEAPKLSKKVCRRKSATRSYAANLKIRGLPGSSPRGGSHRSLTKEANICITKPGDEVNDKRSKLSSKRFWSFVSPKFVHIALRRVLRHTAPSFSFDFSGCRASLRILERWLRTW